MVEIDWNPDRQKLREFGWFSLAGFGLIGLLLGWKLGWIENGQWLFPAIFWGVGLLSAIFALVEPLVLKPIYWILTAISAIVGPVIGTLVLALIFLFVFLPIGLFFKMLGRDGLKLKLDRQTESYWLPADPLQHPRRYLRQF